MLWKNSINDLDSFLVCTGYLICQTSWTLQKAMESIIVTGFVGQTMSFALMLYGELLYGTWPQHKPRKCFKGYLKVSIAAFHIENAEWETVICNQYKCTILEGSSKNRQRVGQIVNLKLGKGESLIQQSIISHMMDSVGYLSLLQASLSTRRNILIDLTQIMTSTMLEITCKVCQKTCRNHSGLSY